MPEKILIDNCSPTLAGLKTASMVNVVYNSSSELAADIREMNRVFSEDGIRVVPLRFRNRHALIYIYRPDYLRRDIADLTAMQILEKQGYPCGNPDACVARLAARIRSQEEFPHEVGLFLGYPPADVSGFIEHKDVGCKGTGYWRVYSDLAGAQKTFAQYRHCTEVYRRSWERGTSIRKLTVRSLPKRSL